MTAPIGYPGSLRGAPTWPALGASPTAIRCQFRHSPGTSSATRPVALDLAIAHNPKEKIRCVPTPFPTVCPAGFVQTVYFIQSLSIKELKPCPTSI